MLWSSSGHSLTEDDLLWSKRRKLSSHQVEIKRTKYLIFLHSMISTTNDFNNYSIDAFQVCCSNKEEGCKWKGELGQLDNYLNLNNLSEENELEGCAFANSYQMLLL